MGPEVKYAKLNRKMFETGMPDNLKKAFITLVQQHPALQQSDKDFVCEHIHHFDDIDEIHRTDVLDVIDGMNLFIHNPHTKSDILEK